MTQNLSTLNGRHFKRLLLLALSFLCCSWLGLASADQAAAPLATQTLVAAELTSLSGKQTVELPHILQSGDFNHSGSTVHYRLVVELPGQPDAALAVFVSKLSLSGRLSLNGQEVGSCADGRLQDVRCLNQPNLFVPPKSAWRVGANTLDFEIYANSRQANGLTPVLVGDALELRRGPYRKSFLLKQDIAEGITWVSLLLGFLALAAALVMRSASLYFWFGLTCVSNALVNLSFLITYPPVTGDLFSWFIFASRMASSCLLLLTLVYLFAKEESLRWLQRLLVAYSIFGPTLIAVTDNNRMVVVALYAPLALVALGMLLAMVRWSWQSRRPLHVITTLMLCTLFAMAMLDWARLAGRAVFDGVYLITYGYPGVMLIIGGMLLGLLTAALRTSRELSATLEEQVVARTKELGGALERIGQMEQTTRLLTENIPVGTYVMETTSEGVPRFTFLSERWLKMLDVRREDVLADPNSGFRIVHPDDYEAFLALNKEVFAEIKPLHWEGRIVVNGQIRWLSVESVPRRLAQGGAVWEGVMVDITAYKEAEASLKLANQAILAAEIERSKQEERERLLQDMHDGFGSQLSTARIMAEQGTMTQTQLTQVLQECMSDLYLVADALRQTDLTLEDALVDFRFRIERRLLGMSTQVHWNIQIAQLPEIAQRIILQVLRILQEALNNALKHAKAGAIWIEARYEPEQRGLLLSVADDGVGLPTPLVYGRGLRNIQRRAREIGAELSIPASEPGTRISLRLIVQD